MARKKKYKSPFRELVDRRRDGRTYGEVAEDCGISRPFLYLLFRGANGTERSERIAAGLKLSVTTVNRALRETREIAELAS